MGNRPSQPSAAQQDELERRKPELAARAACAINQADILIVATGAGWSADSGLAVYRDVADVAAYRDRGLTYRDICQPQYLEEDPALFHGFWGGCYNDYRDVTPHEGYAIVKRWVERRFRYTEAAAQLRQMNQFHREARGEAESGESGGVGGSGGLSLHAGAFYAYTSNVDAHWHTAGFGPYEVHEIHGNCESWQCAERCVAERWQAPPDHRFRVDATTRLAPEGEPLVPPSAPVKTGQARAADAFAANWPTCVRCGGAARPAVLMFGDQSYQNDDASESAWESWRHDVMHVAKSKGYRVAILEVGCGGNVTTVRLNSETMLEEMLNEGVDATLVRINPELPLADQPGVTVSRILPILSTGLRAVKMIDELMHAPAGDAAPTKPIARSFAAPFDGFTAGGLAPERAEPPPHAFSGADDGASDGDGVDAASDDAAAAEGMSGRAQPANASSSLATGWTLPDAKKAASAEDALAQARLDKMRALLSGVDADLKSSSSSRAAGLAPDDDDDMDDDEPPRAGAMRAWERFAHYPERAKAAAAAAPAPSRDATAQIARAADAASGFDIGDEEID